MIYRETLFLSILSVHPPGNKEEQMMYQGAGICSNGRILKYHFQQKAEKMLGSWLVLYV